MFTERMDAQDLVILGDNLAVLGRLPRERFQVIYIDPPFNTGSRRERRIQQAVRSEYGNHVGFGGNRYATTFSDPHAYPDRFDDYIPFLRERICLARELLTESGTLYLHLDYREAHYAKVMLDELFGRECFLNEIIWAYDYGGRARDRWPAKHDTILVYVKTAGCHFFNQDAIKRIPYMAPGLVTPEKAERGKLPTDVWWQTIVPTNGREKTGYPTQKPEAILKRVIDASSREGDWVLDFFAGSGTTGAVAQRSGRRFVMIDSNPEAVTVMAKRLASGNVAFLDEHGNDLRIP
jgi:site-specific DNA-methyltransferase (adenine-specific)